MSERLDSAAADEFSVVCRSLSAMRPEQAAVRREAWR
jgi:hypothetical protein